MSEFSFELERERRQKSEEEKKESSTVSSELQQTPGKARRSTVSALIGKHESMIRQATPDQPLPGPGKARPSTIPAQPRGTVAVGKPGVGGMESVISGPAVKQARPSKVPPISIANLKASDRFRVQLEGMFPEFVVTVDANFTDQDWQFWESARIYDFFTSLVTAGLLDAQDKGATIKLFPEGPASPGGDRGIRVNIAAKKPLSTTAVTPEGKPDLRPFSLVQVFYPAKEGQTIYVETVVAPSMGRRFVKSGLLAYAQQVKARQLTLKASAIGGSQEGVFAWARYGFVPTAEYWQSIRSSGLNRLRSKKDEISPDIRAELERLLLNPSPQALRWVVYLSWEKKGAVTTFLNAILTSGVSWDGELDLTDPKSLAWISTYAGTTKAENELTTFEKLLPGLSAERVSPEPEQSASKAEIEEEKPQENVVDETEIALLLSTIEEEGMGALEELYRDYAKNPEVIRRVKEALGIN